MAGSARVADDEDFTALKRLVDVEDGFEEVFKEDNVRVCAETGQARGGLRGVRVVALLPNVNAYTLYDVLHDGDYRSYWDNHYIAAEDVGHIDVNNDIGYYAMSCPAPLKNRDFVLQRSWLDMGNEKIILSRSIHHKDYPPRKGFVRAFSLLTGYVIREHPEGCWLGYYSRADPRGQIPAWVVNKVTNMFAPKLVKKLHEASKKYPGWKTLCDRPYYKPWLYPEQVPSYRISIKDCSEPDSAMLQESCDSLTFDRKDSSSTGTSHQDLTMKKSHSPSHSNTSNTSAQTTDEKVEESTAKNKPRKFFKLVKKSIKQRKDFKPESSDSGDERLKKDESKTSKLRRRFSLSKHSALD